MAVQLNLGEVLVDVVFKDIQNVHLSVHPPSGRVRISAPIQMNLDIIRVFAISRLGWIKQQQRKLRKQERETSREYLDLESHYLWGKRYTLKVLEVDTKPEIQLKPNKLVLSIRQGTTEEKKQAMLAQYYRQQIKKEIPSLITLWAPILDVSVDKFYVQHMKTKWGSCNPYTRSIRLNTELAKKPKECLEYIIVHEMCHLIEPTHNSRFVALMDRFIPNWQIKRETLNQLPVRHENWDY